MVLDPPQPPPDQTKQVPFSQLLTMLEVPFWTSSSSLLTLGSQDWMSLQLSLQKPRVQHSAFLEL